MAGTNSLIVTGVDISGDIFTSASWYWALGDNVANSTTEAIKQRKLSAGTASRLGIQAALNSYGAGNVAGYWLRIAGSNGSNTVALNGVGVGWFQDTTHSDSITAGQLCNVAFTANSGGPDFECASQSLIFNAASPLSSQMWAARSGLAIGSTSNNFSVVSSGAETNVTTTEANFKVLARAAGSYENLECYISANTIASVGSNINFRKNGANGNQTVSIGTLATGQFQDTTHTDSVANGDLINYLIDAGAATGAITVNLIDVSNAGATSAQDLVIGSGAGFTNAQSSIFYALSGAALGTTAESREQIKPGYATTLSKLRLNLVANTASVTTTWVSRKNAANGNLLLTLTNGVTGAFEDTTHTDSVAATDAINTEFVANGGTGNSNFTWVAVTSDDGSFTGLKKGGFFHAFP